MSQENTPANITFADLNLCAPVLRAIADAGYSSPTPIQAQAIPYVLRGGDLLAGAQTGTGKTAGFTLPILHCLSEAPLAQAAKGKPRCLILSPTRELAAQIGESVTTYGKYLPLKSMVVFGGVSINPQINRLSKPLDILVATPGRLLDLVQQKALDLSGIEILVLDEADRMLDMGFIHDIKKVLALLPKKRQNLLFSATFSDDIKRLADSLLNAPDLVEVARRNASNALIEQSVHMVPQAHKREMVSYLIKHHQWQQVLVFTRTKHGANRLAEKLVKDGIPAMAIHGNKSQNARTAALAQFKAGTITALVATDIAARGLDIDQLPQVVNFELPNVPEDYVHRIGRTGRAGASGAAISLVDREEFGMLKDIEKLIKRDIPKLPVEGFVAPEKGSEEPDRPPRGQNHGRQRQGQSQKQGQPRQGQSQPQAQAGANKPGPGKPNPHKSGHANPGQRNGHQAQHRQGGNKPQGALFTPKPGANTANKTPPKAR
ncbi:DEAD/DEAH box helicase [Methylophilus sp. QUAN]|uniref:DEAD/DEAH box helicase n=1 Tax=Methylophilus sp. QUAN TaxID=2781020 RepID=UPI00188FDA63|nr:DEAD/DEAH box helicase [Methylophilus sp. QUAN]MBF4991368.1 DEAD/DEAH box helicase [Methylophilus sp. QUAN]